jgi:hypothetical protein
MTKYLPWKFKGRSYSFWLLILEVSVYHDEKGMVEESSSCQGRQEAEKGIQEEAKTRAATQGHVPMTYFL